jgi:NTP pyrophosphatase (non-canonical NTP hydrolase)
MNNLSFKNLRKKNVRRSRKFHRLHDWSITDWTLALVGEAGELANLAKKHKRGDKTYWEKGKEKKVNKRALGMELADVVIYADLLAARLGIKLEDLIIEKFNEVSKRCGSKIQL